MFRRLETLLLAFDDELITDARVCATLLVDGGFNLPGNG